MKHVAVLGLALLACNGASSPPESSGGAPGSGGGASGGGAGGAGGAAPSETISCVAWTHFTIPEKPYFLNNNQWNAEAAGAAPFEQCLLSRAAGATTEYGWSWQWPTASDSSFASPEIVFGRQPWGSAPSTSPALPRTISALDHLWLDFDVEIAGGPGYSLNAEIWITKTDAAPSAADPEDIVAEVTVIFDNPDGSEKCCTSEGNVTLAGTSFEVFHDEGGGEDAEGNVLSWPLLSYFATDPTAKARFDLSLVFGDLVARGIVVDANGVQGVELGTRVGGGSGEAWLKKFDVQVE